MSESGLQTCANAKSVKYTLLLIYTITYVFFDSKNAHACPFLYAMKFEFNLLHLYRNYNKL